MMKNDKALLCQKSFHDSFNSDSAGILFSYQGKKIFFGDKRNGYRPQNEKIRHFSNCTESLC